MPVLLPQVTGRSDSKLQVLFRFLCLLNHWIHDLQVDGSMSDRMNLLL